MAEEYNVFISWSGPRSKWVAEAMREWLPVVLQAAKPWMSETDIEKGSRGLTEVSSKLVGMKVGIVCLTSESLNAPWILYEAGALSKTIDDKTRLCTYLLGGLQFQDVEYPLGMFQATNSTKDDTRKLVHTINRSVSENPVTEKNLDQLFDRMWADLEKKIATMPKTESIASTKRPPEEIMTELLELARAEANNRKLLEGKLSEIEWSLNNRFSSFMSPSLLTSPLTADGVYYYPTKAISLHDLMVRTPGTAGENAGGEPKVTISVDDNLSLSEALKKSQGQSDAAEAKTDKKSKK
ncbi:MAG: toll/interleukin-1 receptor domain-containing protein [Candidatus Acidiferrales bacterium]